MQVFDPGVGARADERAPGAGLHRHVAHGHPGLDAEGIDRRPGEFNRITRGARRPVSRGVTKTTEYSSRNLHQEPLSEGVAHVL